MEKITLTNKQKYALNAFFGLIMLILACLVIQSYANEPVSTVQFVEIADMTDEQNEYISAQIDSCETAYINEIDSLCTANGFEIDVDACDIANVKQVEQWAVKYLCSYFYMWRQTQSKTSWEYDVMIARFCY